MNLENIRLIAGNGDGVTTACLMSARALLDGRPFGDDHPSGVLRHIGVRINDGDWWDDDGERTVTLLSLALDERLCASKCNASPAAEKVRANLCAEWALSFAAPFVLDQAALALEAKWPDDAKALRGHSAQLRAQPTRENAQVAGYAANAAANATTDAANAVAGYAAYAAATDAANAAYRAANAADAAAYAANVAYAAAYAANAAAKAAYAVANRSTTASARKEVRDSFIALFGRLLEVNK